MANTKKSAKAAKTDDRVLVQARVAAPVARKIVAAAKKEQRSMARQAVYILTEWAKDAR